MPARRPLRLHLTTSPPPLIACNGRPTVFGLQDRSGHLMPGTTSPEGRLSFTLDLEVSQDAATGKVRFHSPFIHAPAAGRFLYLSWRYTDGSREWVRRQKLPLASLTWDQVGGPTGTRCTYAAEVPSITERCATIPVEWRAVGDANVGNV